jgi:hypothetical protein
VEQNKHIFTQIKYDNTHWNNSAIYGHLHVVKWLHENRKEGCTEWTMNYAARNGHLDVVKWLHEHRTEGCTLYAVMFASYNDHLHILQFLYENGYQHYFTCLKNRDGTPSYIFINTSPTIKQWIQTVIWKQAIVE